MHASDSLLSAQAGPATWPSEELRAESSHPRRLRVLHVISSLEEGGAAKGTVQMVSGLNASGEVDSRLCVLGTNHRSVSTERIPGGPTFLDCPVGRKFRFLKRWRKLRAIVNEFRPDIVHGHSWPTATDVSRVLTGQVKDVLFRRPVNATLRAEFGCDQSGPGIYD